MTPGQTGGELDRLPGAERETPDRVLLVDDDSRFVEMAAQFLEREADDWSIVTETSAVDGLERIDREPVDCVVSDYNMADMTGLAFLERVREVLPDLPFILFTGRGSEGIASEAISSGVTDYLQKTADADQYTLLANRIRNAIERYRTTQELSALQHHYELVARASADAFAGWDVETDRFWWSEGIRRTFGYDEDEVENDFAWWKSRVHPEDRRDVLDSIHEVVEDWTETFELEHRFRRDDGTYAYVISRGHVVYDEGGDPVRAVGALIDITERKEYEQKLLALHDVTRDLLRAETKDDVGRTVATTAADVLDLSHVAIYLFDTGENVLRPTACSSDLVAGVDDLSTVAAGDSAAWRAFVDGETVARGSESGGGGRYGPDERIEGELVVPMGDHGVFVAASEDEGAFDDTVRRLADFLAVTAETALDRVERATDLSERDRKLREQRAHLDRLVQVNEQIRTIEQAVVHATTRTEIEEAVCERLVEIDRFAFAWIGAFDPEADGLSPRTWAGDGDGYLDAMFYDEDWGDIGREPGHRAEETGELVAVANTAEALHDEPWREAALSYGYHSAVSVPIAHEDITYGVIAVYANRPDAFDALAQSVFGELGNTVAHAINAVETKQSLLTDSVVELHLWIEGADDFLRRVAQRTGCSVEFNGAVPSSDEAVCLYFSSRGADAEEVCSLAGRSAGVDDIRLVDDEDDECLFEVIVSGSTLVEPLSKQGAVPKTIVAGSEGIRAVVELPRGADVRKFIERIQVAYPGTELVARRDRNRSIQTREAFRQRCLNRLTERQHEVVRTAYLSGYFEWPRTSSGEVVADSLGISQPTFHSHLRRSEQKLFSMLFDDSEPSPEFE